MKISIKNLKNAISLTLVVALGILFLSNTSSTHKLNDEVLNGKTFSILNLEGGKKISDPIVDELFFKSDKLKSKVLATENKFKPEFYTVCVDPACLQVIFECISMNDAGETLHWEGTVKGDEIEGTATLSKKGKIKKQYAFFGNLKNRIN